MTFKAPFPLRDYNTFGLDVTASYGLELTDLQLLPALNEYLDETKHQKLVVGEGSNILFTDHFDGVVIVNRLKGVRHEEDETHHYLHVAGGENWHTLVVWSLANGIPGLENLALIPGTVGAAPVQNIGAYGHEFKDFCTYVDVWSFETSQIQRFPATECGFGYRDSIFKHELKDKILIIAVGIALPKQWQPHIQYGPLKALGEKATAEQVFETICSLRRSKLPDPAVLGNAGSFFKNPIVTKTLSEQLKADYPDMPIYPVDERHQKLAAGWLIEQAGLKGFVHDKAGIHQDQALVVVNRGGASSQNIIQVAQIVGKTVKEKFGIQLEPEVRFMGALGEIDNLQAIL